jgi:PPOX class probable F420-dependent enzyme
MGRMTDTEWQAFANEGERIGVLATVRKDGRPHALPIYFVVDAGDVVFTTPKASIKAKSILRTGAATLLVSDDAIPYSFAMIEGKVEVETDPKTVFDWTVRVHERYVDAESARTSSERLTEGDAEILCRLKPANVFAIGDVAGTFSAEGSVS